MTSSELLLEGFELMLFGVGAVFLFLILLIGCIRLMSLLVGRFESVPASLPACDRPVVAAVADADLIAAIQAAIHQHRARRG
ncbi:OadG family protein [Stutzerimonas stutzeri]|uniref:OadG family protein n=1 Tax=Stutzerimonas stutzeri TaxID=316 RepID=UPI0015E37590|nr:OadG family transporter subunit [Stutzerimonas stutzeri]MBA1262548.1 oxaloacetate decarboxylase [Stutzerimonas stutzeri]